MEYLDPITATLIAIVVPAGVYLAVRLRETWNANQRGPAASVSGVESAEGTKAVVSNAFTETGTGALVGRVDFLGENWRAEYVGTSGEPPGVGQHVAIRETDSGNLTVFVVAMENHDQSTSHDPTAGDRLLGYGIVGWFAVCVPTTMVWPKIGFTLLALSVLVVAIYAAMLHSVS